MSALFPKDPNELRALNQATWTVARRLGTYSYASLSAEAHVSIPLVCALNRRWADMGAVSKHAERSGGRVMFTVCRNDETSPGARRGTTLPVSPEQAMWVAIRRSGAFTPTDIGAIANTAEVPISPEQVRAYLQMLLSAGYLKVVRKAVPRKVEPVYKLLRDTGPLAPTSKRLAVVYDSNKREIVHVPPVPK